MDSYAVPRITQTEEPLIWGSNKNGLVDPNLHELFVKTPIPLKTINGTVNDITLAENHAAAIDSNGDVYQWGNCESNKGAPQCTMKNMKAKQLASNSKYVFALAEDVISAGEHHIVALTSKGRVFTGALNEYGNYFGQLGNGIEEPRNENIFTLKDQFADKPRHYQLDLGHLEDIVPFSVRQEGMLKTYRYEQPELISAKKYLDEIKMGETKFKTTTKIIDISCGDFHTMALDSEGRVFGFGSNHHLQLGKGDYYKNPVPFLSSPEEITKFWPGNRKPQNSRVTKIAAGGLNSMVVVDSPENSKLFVLGSGMLGQLGNKSWQQHAIVPESVADVSDKFQYDEKIKDTRPIRIKQISCGGGHMACVLDTQNDGSTIGDQLYIWGYNKDYQLGNGKRRNFNSPTSVLLCDERQSCLPLQLKRFQNKTQQIICGYNTSAII
ncbi:RCC1/BLIP-II [Rozella allomycis CSF55]|uniref:RCC1/BLIP-II n=1 Tax=Rozella allomycis (strain CSF55) TaxID=988480 RepID=A0A075B1S9_ROZAC|nr:Regulator of chromosome condensation, RCC1 domain-containing protein [Rozella allomycis CSF55]RKP21203.1 RCC1/BLIP-II [Rozella allomycis CSF55]|eukprot:EPZ34926.1 Regulator of chromosome condensation, RCC1 domain-containing protein [Rozella allomycis CSF55]